MAAQPGHPRTDIGQAPSPSPPPSLSPSSPQHPLPPPPPPPPPPPLSASERTSEGDDSVTGTSAPNTAADHIPTASTTTATTATPTTSASTSCIQHPTCTSLPCSSSSSSSSLSSSEQPPQATTTTIPGRATIKKRQRLHPAEPVVRPANNPYSHSQSERRSSTGHHWSTNNATSSSSGSPPALTHSHPNKARTISRRSLEGMPPLKDFYCPICRSLMKEAFISRCGHSFCYLCISHHLEEKKDCPMCRSPLSRDQIFPNFLLNSIVEKSSSFADLAEEVDPRPRLRSDILNQMDYTREEIDDMLSTLTAKKRKLEATDRQVEMEVLLDFLKNTRAQKEAALARLKLEIECLDHDVVKAQDQLEALKEYHDNGGSICSSSSSSIEGTLKALDDMTDSSLSTAGSQVPNEASEGEEEAVPHAGSKRSISQMEKDDASDSNGSVVQKREPNHQAIKLACQVSMNKRRVGEHFQDLQRCYFDLALNSSTKRESALSSFSTTISKFTRYSRFEHINTLRYGDIFNTSSIVSSIEFDRDDEFFATAGVTKKIKIFEYGCIEKSGLMGTSLRDERYGGGLERYPSNKKPINSVLHYPVKEMVCRSKISCLSWNAYVKSQIASSDYEGVVSLWDSQTGANTLNYNEHEKRAWSVDFSRTDPTRLASGSDDTKVKIWSTTQKSSAFTIDSKANICCVKFNPESSHHIAFGSADHHIHYYDLRKASEPLFVFKGHRKAVSYVKFIGREELVSASTDSTLKLWSTSSLNCVRTYTGHVNEKNFVGLSANGDWISCGSENNAVYTYYKELQDPVVTIKFGNSNPVTGEDVTEDDPSQFVSSVCWKKNSSNNILLAANSSGVIKVLELV